MYPVLARFGPITIGTHDFFTLLGLVVGVALYYRALRRDQILDPRIITISLAAIVGGALGARLITSWEVIDEVQAAGLPFTYVVTHGPRSIIGGLAGGYAAIILTKRALGYRVSTGDYYVVAIPLALAIGRVGCFLSELPLGTPTDLPWGITVSPEAAAAYLRCPGCDGPMHPSMLYEIGFQVAAFVVLWRWSPMLPVRGDTLKAYLLVYGIFRFNVEWVRGNEVQFAGLTGPQLVLMPLIALLVLYFLRRIWTDAYRLPTPMPVLAKGGPDN
ncbi:MAG TPA: prolipoprotein diacylglyceryl transferase family protein [Candidatus Limnocylindria bacterium]|jgi:prolipoprotein diacylglyceryltransferase